jgi:hypothetical protein
LTFRGTKERWVLGLYIVLALQGWFEVWHTHGDGYAWTLAIAATLATGWGLWKLRPARKSTS